ncbi:DUF3267 domain-containing protein [Pedobacter sp. GR22-6]|uniref:DUF3267 domain-containing protein n=1 Tax=Pedobacter sp. GR22-6 TaxID=3127957 RepID=UPI00307D7528
MNNPDPKFNNAQELTISAGEAQLRSIAYFLPFALIFGLAFYALWPDRLSSANYKAAFPSGAAGIALLVGVMIGGVIVHELIHGITWSRFAASGFRSIRFGILWKSMTPYCHCKEPLKVSHYQIGAAAPGLILGIIPAAIALFTGSILLLAFGLFFTMAAGGDLMIILMLRKQDQDSLVQDHPSKIGCLIYPKYS